MSKIARAFMTPPLDPMNVGWRARRVARQTFREIPIVPAQPGPVVTNISPSVGAGINAQTPLTLQVTSPVLAAFRSIIVEASFPVLGVYEVVHDGLQFGPNYNQLSSKVPIAGGFNFTILRNGGWPGSPTIVVNAVDVNGNENS
jgi:hypothetical protein